MLWGERKLREVLHEPCAPLEENLLLTQVTERSLLDQITEDLNLIDIKKPVLLPYALETPKHSLLITEQVGRACYLA